LAFQVTIWHRVSGGQDVPAVLPYVVPLPVGRRGKLGFEFGNALLERGHRRGHFVGGEAGRDVFGAVPIKRHDFDEEQALDAGAQFRRGRQLIGQGRMFARVEHAGVTEQFQPFLARVVHEEERHAVTRGEMAGGEELAVAPEIGEAKLIGAENFQKARRPAAMLDVGPAVFSDGGQVETVARGNEIGFLGGEGVALRRGRELGRATVVVRLRRAHGGGEGGGQVFERHAANVPEVRRGRKRRSEAARQRRSTTIW
jgi:hypothetical protein